MKGRFKFPKKEKLKSKKAIQQLFGEGYAITSYPLKILYLRTELREDINIRTGVAVPKKNFKTAVKRNRIKRLIRESYRLNKHHIFNNIDEGYAFLFLYIGKELQEYSVVEESMLKLFAKFLKKVHHEKDNQ